VPEPVVIVEGVSKCIKNQTLVEKIDIEIAAGQVLALCGGNGAGKSTIIRMIAGIMQPSSGAIYINGLQWRKERKAFAKQIGYMPDDYQFSQGLTAAETLSFWAALRQVPKLRVEETLVLVGLSDKKNKQVNTFSKGMRQRLLFAQAILAKPPFLIMDEPTNGLDPFWMNEFVQLINRTKLEGCTVLFSTHQLQIAEEVADHVLFLNNGRNCGEGSVAHFRDLYGSHALHTAFQEVLK
jgi:Cu-processing system ATP-binding protein